MINELLNSREKYIEITFKEKMLLISSTKSDIKVTRKVSMIVAWLHESLVNEISVLEVT